MFRLKERRRRRVRGRCFRDAIDDKGDAQGPLGDTCQTTFGMDEDSLVESAADTLLTMATAGSGGSSSSNAGTTPADCTPPNTQPAATQQLPQGDDEREDASPMKKARVDKGPVCLAVAEQISVADGQEMIVDAFNDRAFELSLGLDAPGENEPPKYTAELMECVMIEVPDCASALAVAEQTVH